MTSSHPWNFKDLTFYNNSNNNIALESQSNTETNIREQSPFFKPVNITSENGIYYCSIYLCHLVRYPKLMQKTLMWLDSLKTGDCVKLNINSTEIDIPIFYYIPILGGIFRCKATIDIELDKIICDTQAYFYLSTDKVTVGKCGALFIPSYTNSTSDKKSLQWTIVHDFVNSIIDIAVNKNWLTSDDRDNLNKGVSVTLDPEVMIDPIV